MLNQVSKIILTFSIILLSGCFSTFNVAGSSKTVSTTENTYNQSLRQGLNRISLMAENGDDIEKKSLKKLKNIENSYSTSTIISAEAKAKLNNGKHAFLTHLKSLREKTKNEAEKEITYVF